MTRPGAAAAVAPGVALGAMLGRTLGWVLGWALVMTIQAPARAAEASPSCGPHLAGPARQQAERDGWVIAFAPRPWPVPVGQHFALDIAVCPPPATAAPVSLKVDADMPAHRHGMNYRPTVQGLGGGRFRAEGLMFHMPGHWRLQFSPDDAAPLLRELTVR